jgi:hypothetical protein
MEQAADLRHRKCERSCELKALLAYSYKIYYCQDVVIVSILASLLYSSRVFTEPI